MDPALSSNPGEVPLGVPSQSHSARKKVVRTFQRDAKNVVGMRSFDHGTNKEPKPNLRRAHTISKSANLSTKSSPGKSGRGRTASLRRGKHSNEVLRPKASVHLHENTSESRVFTAAREGRHFTVGNVGHNGKIYLRYVLLLRLLYINMAPSCSIHI